MSGEERCRRVSVSGSLRERRSEEMTYLNTSSPRGSEVPLESQRAWWQSRFPRMKRFMEEERMEGEKESVLPSVGQERIRGGGGGVVCTLRNESEKELFREMLTPT